MNWPMIVAASFIGLIVVLLLIARARERRAWNNSVCAQCGGAWCKATSAGWDWEGQFQWFECCNGHRIGLQWIKRQAPEMPAPAAKEIRAALERTLSSWRQPGAGVRLDLIQRARTVLREIHDDELLNLRMTREGDNVIRLYRTRADDVFEELCLRIGGYYRYEGPAGCGGCAVDHKMGAAAIAALFGSDRCAVAEPPVA